ncbi:MAG: glycine--tRNA ligase subunit beta [bacterium]|nr:glycine--tRNA ligase subunit beta [bacterium]
MQKDLLLEIGTEELPASYIEPALSQLKIEAEKLFSEAIVEFRGSEVYGTPRRLALILYSVKELETKEEEIVGPPATASADGFAKKYSALPKDLVIKEKKGGKYWCLIKKKERKPIEEIAQHLLPQLISSISFPKSMRWKGNFTFARPIRWIVALLGDKLIPFEIEGVKTQGKSLGLRGMPPIFIASPASYLSTLKENGVMVNQTERREYILSNLKDSAKEVGAEPLLSESLLDEVVNMVEDPVIIRGRFNKRYLKIPKDVVIASMVSHQRYFPLLKGNELTEYFLAVGNSKKSPLIRKGYERILSARLADASFFWKEDKKIPLETFASKLKGVTWQEGLGSVHEKTLRCVRLAASLSLRLLGPKDIRYVERAAYLAKADLMTQMVSEFPKLQGIMGYHYAKCEGIEEEIALAIREHYEPLPSSSIAKVVGLADRIDTLVGYFAFGYIPKGSEDPQGLRRAGNSVIQIILEADFRTKVLLSSIISEACKGYKQINKEKIMEKVLPFLKTRLEFILSSSLDKNIVGVVADADFDDPKDCKERAFALSRSIKQEGFPNLTVSIKRVMNILKNAEKNGFNESLLVEPAEKELYSILTKTELSFQSACQRKDYDEAFLLLSKLRPSIDKFFDEVLVETDDQRIRENRKALLFLISDLFLKLADLSKVL